MGVPEEVGGDEPARGAVPNRLHDRLTREGRAGRAHAQAPSTTMHPTRARHAERARSRPSAVHVGVPGGPGRARRGSMARHYATRDFFRQMPNPLLARYFHARGVFDDLDIAALPEPQPEELWAAWLTLDDAVLSKN